MGSGFPYLLAEKCEADTVLAIDKLGLISTASTEPAVALLMRCGCVLRVFMLCVCVMLVTESLFW